MCAVSVGRSVKVIVSSVVDVRDDVDAMFDDIEVVCSSVGMSKIVQHIYNGSE